MDDDTPAPRRDRGFTLVEIIVAIVLVGILSAVVVVGVSSLTDKGGSAACMASRDAALAASVNYFAGARGYPSTIQQLVDGGHLELADGVTMTSAVIADGDGWTLTMVPTGPTTKPAFTCT